MISIIDPNTNASFAHALVGSRQCYAVPHGRAFAVRVDGLAHVRQEAVISVDGRDVLTNTPASTSAGGVVFSGSYVCNGFQISASEARQFVHMPSGHGYLTAERAGSSEAVGVIAAAVYSEQHRGRHELLVSRGVTRGSGGQSVTRGGTMAGAEVSAPLGTTTFVRGDLALCTVEYDTFDGWAARGIVIPRLSEANPWPGSAPRFASSNSL